MNRTFNFIYSRMLSATKNKELAAQTAMQYALDQDKRDYASNAAEKERQVSVQKQNMTDQYVNKKIQMQRDAASKARHDALVNSMLATFGGLAGAAAGAAIGGPFGAAAGSQIGSAAAKNVAGVNYDENIIPSRSSTGNSVAGT